MPTLMRLRELNLPPNQTVLLATLLQNEPGFVWLDSAEAQCHNGRYSLLSCRPREILVHRYGERSASDFLDYWNERYRARALQQNSHLPFAGGWLGALYYDFGEELMNISPAPEKTERPTAYAAYHPWAVIVDHDTQTTYWVDDGQELDAFAGSLKERLLNNDLALPPSSQAVITKPTWQARETQAHYYRAIDRILQYLLAGDSYQVNYAQRFEADFNHTLWPMYLALRGSNQAPYSACLLNTALDDILCFSPELFIKADQGHLFTQPIKGTSPRGEDHERDKKLATQLSHSVKNRAENIMIVDLLRNDFGRVCIPGSIRVDALCELQSYPSVHHLVSEIRGVLAPGKTPIDALKAVFPGGSITGAPKKRSMEIIRELEPSSRGIYCGSVFSLSNHGSFTSNIAIRTISVSDGLARVWGGGGIVSDSIAEEEYQETFDKLSKILV